MVSTRTLNLALQRAMILAVLPDATCAIRKGALNAVMRLQPTPASRTYTVRLVYQPPKQPRVTVLEPDLDLYPGAARLPHVYAGNELCLYTPGEWDHHMSLATTIIPWIAEWLFFYEGWLAIGKWEGGGLRHEAAA